MASCGVRILGSGTLETPRSLMPFQQTARMTSPSVLGPARWLALDRGNFSRLHQLLEAAQVLPDPVLRILDNELRDGGSEPTGWHPILEDELHLRTALAGGGGEKHRADLLHL